ncbi:MAG: hypothetical protein K8R23_06795 [Chthoniobacter sp.]|nr:hypothetical protein [Chthoniobacter sp.]
MKPTYIQSLRNSKIDGFRLVSPQDELDDRIYREVMTDGCPRRSRLEQVRGAIAFALVVGMLVKNIYDILYFGHEAHPPMRPTRVSGKSIHKTSSRHSPNENHATIFAALFVALCFVVSVQAAGIPWPKHYVLHEGSESPNKRFGVIIPNRDAIDEDREDVRNYLADLKQHQIVGTISASHYSEGRNHSGMKMVWAPDSTWCVCVYEARFGFASITVLQIDGNTLTQREIGDHVQKSLDQVIVKESHKKETEGCAQVHLRPSADRKLLVRATATTNPKAFEDRKPYWPAPRKLIQVP